MHPLCLFEIWAPDASVWSAWTKPVLFAHALPLSADDPPLNPPSLPDWLPPANGRTAIVANLPGPDAVRWGVALAATGYQPVPLFNTSPGPAATIDVRPILTLLSVGAGVLQETRLPAEAPPAFLIDAQRTGGGLRPLPGDFDNRWVVFPQDFPSATYLQRHGVSDVLLLQSATPYIADDLCHVLLRWQTAGLTIRMALINLPDGPQDLRVRRPLGFGWLWYRLLVAFGLRRNSAGGFGAVVPLPSSGGYGGFGGFS